MTAIVDCLIYFCCFIPISYFDMPLKNWNQKWHIWFLWGGLYARICQIYFSFNWCIVEEDSLVRFRDIWKNEGESSSFGATSRVLTVILLVRKVTEILTLQKTDREHVLHTVENFITKKGARFQSPPILSLVELNKTERGCQIWSCCRKLSTFDVVDITLHL